MVKIDQKGQMVSFPTYPVILVLVKTFTCVAPNYSYNYVIMANNVSWWFTT